MIVEIFGGPRDGELFQVAGKIKKVAFSKGDNTRYVSEETSAPSPIGPDYFILKVLPHPYFPYRGAVYWPKDSQK